MISLNSISFNNKHRFVYKNNLAFFLEAYRIRISLNIRTYAGNTTVISKANEEGLNIKLNIYIYIYSAKKNVKEIIKLEKKISLSQ